LKEDAMSIFRTLVRPGLIAISLAAVNSVAALAETTPPAPSDHLNHCFYMSQWHGWSAPSEDVLYLRVNMHEIYKVELASGTSLLQAPDVHLVSVERGSDSVCFPIDLELSVSDGFGIKERLIAKSISKLTDAEVAAIPKKYVP